MWWWIKHLTCSGIAGCQGWLKMQEVIWYVYVYGYSSNFWCSQHHSCWIRFLACGQRISSEKSCITTIARKSLPSNKNDLKSLDFW